MQTKQNLKNFGLIMSSMIALLFGLIIPILKQDIFYYTLWPWAIASIFMLLSLFQALWLNQIYKAWMKVGHILGWFNTRVILALLFFGLLTPIGLILRLFNKDPLLKKIDPNLTSYRIPCKSINPAEFERPF